MGNGMTQSELILFWITIVLYILAAGIFLYGLIIKSERPFKLGVKIILIGLVIQTTALGLRWYYAGHMPGDNIYELNFLGAWLAVFIYFWLQSYYRKIRVLGMIVLTISILMMMYGISKPHEMGPLSDEYQSGWFYVHIISSFLAYGCYVIATSSAIFFLIRGYIMKMGSLYEKLPSPNLLEDLSYRFVAYGFGAHAIMLVSGSIWANNAWGSYWNWDPVETWSLITWLIYAFYLHARTFLGWKGKRLAWITIFALIAIIYSFWGIPHLPSKDYSHV